MEHKRVLYTNLNECIILLQTSFNKYFGGFEASVLLVGARMRPLALAFD